MNPIFCFLTDFGHDFAVASMEALILKELPQARIMHLDHSIEKFCIASAAFVLKNTYNYFPQGTIFISIVDPGVGSKRETLCVETANYTFIGPNNGIFHYILQEKYVNIWHINQDIIKPAFYTFHGRDLFTPAAIKIAQNDKTCLTPANTKDIVYSQQLDQPMITYIDSFGNIKTNIALPEEFKGIEYVSVKIDTSTNIAKFSSTFSQVKPGELIVYLGSNNTLEIAANLDSARQKLNAKPGQIVHITPIKKGALCF